MENKKKRSALQFNIWHCCEFPPLPVTPADFRSFVSGPVSRFGAPRQTTAIADGCVSAVRASVSLALICASRCVSRRPRISRHPYYRTLAEKKKKPARCSSYFLRLVGFRLSWQQKKEKKKRVFISRPLLSLLPLFCRHRSSHLFQPLRLRALLSPPLRLQTPKSPNSCHANWGWQTQLIMRR